MHKSPCNCVKCSLRQINVRQHSTNQGERHIFYGHKEEPMFAMETKIDLPELGEDEVLVKVRAATICISDIHTVTGARIEPTPRLIFYLFLLFSEILFKICLFFVKVF